MRTARTAELSAAEARWLAIGAQGLGRDRPSGPADRARLRRGLAAAGVVQLDAINVLARTQFLVLFSRIGAYESDRLLDLSAPGGELFEYWGHAASLQPTALHPLLRWRMARFARAAGRGAWEAQQRAWRAAHADYIAAVLDEVRDRGALPASGLSDPRRRSGTWWDRRSSGRMALEWLFATGDLAAWRSSSFERIYDLPERVLAAGVHQAPTPDPDGAQGDSLVQQPWLVQRDGPTAHSSHGSIIPW